MREVIQPLLVGDDVVEDGRGLGDPAGGQHTTSHAIGAWRLNHLGVSRIASP